METQTTGQVLWERPQESDGQWVTQKKRILIPRDAKESDGK